MKKRMGRVCYLISKVQMVNPLFVQLINRQVKEISKLSVIVGDDDLRNAEDSFSKLVNLYSASLKQTKYSKNTFVAMMNIIRPDTIIVSVDDNIVNEFISFARIKALRIAEGEKCVKGSEVFYITSNIPESSRQIIDYLEEKTKLDFYPKHYVQKKAIASQMTLTEILKACLKRKDRVKTDFEKEWGYKLPDIPQTYNDSLNQLKIKSSYSRYKKYTDKFKVRKYIRGLGFEKYLPKCLGIVNVLISKRLWNKLPDRFIIKPTNASGFNIVIDNKCSNDRMMINRFLRYIKSVHYGLRKNEPVYSFSNRFLFTEYIDDITDYKFYCFNGNAEFIAVVREMEKENDNREPYQMIVDKKFRELPFSFGYERGEKCFNKPCYFNQMVNVAEAISKRFKHVRVDMIGNGTDFFFGKLTFFPGGGRDRFNPCDYDLRYGKLLNS